MIALYLHDAAGSDALILGDPYAGPAPAPSAPASTPTIGGDPWADRARDESVYFIDGQIVYASELAPLEPVSTVILTALEAALFDDTTLAVVDFADGVEAHATAPALDADVQVLSRDDVDD